MGMSKMNFKSVKDWVDAGKPMNSFVLGDCMEGMREMQRKSFDLAIVDVQYGIGESMNDNKSRSVLARSRDYGFKIWDSEPPPPEYFSELIRVSENQVIFGANHFISRFSLDSSCWIVWDKDNGENDFADCELAWTSFSTAVRRFKYKWHGMLQENMKQKERRIHPTQKPVALYRWLLINYAQQGDAILDTHVGSASSLIACIDMGFQYLGFEKDEDYFEAACRRIENHKRQENLFKPQEMYAKNKNLSLEI